MPKFLGGDSETSVSDDNKFDVGLENDSNKFPELNSDGDL